MSKENSEELKNGLATAINEYKKGLKEYLDKRISPELDSIIDSRSMYVYTSGNEKILATGDGRDNHFVSCAMPIITEGDIIGCVVSMSPMDSEQNDNRELETKLVQTAANFLSKQLES